MRGSGIIFGMPDLEWRGVSPEEFARELTELVRQYREQKYAFQVGLEDIDFEVDEDKVNTLGITFPFPDIGQAESALRAGVITPVAFLEDDDTRHQVVVFDPEPVGFSGFRDCATHSLALTDLGLFEVGRYPAMSLTGQSRYWQWFIHRRRATSEEVAAWQEYNLSPTQVVNLCFEALTGIERPQ